MNLATKRAPLRIKAADVAVDGTFEGYGGVFGNVDSGGDLIPHGAFAASLARHREDGTRPKLLLHHDHQVLVGSWLEMREDGHGLHCRGRLLLDVPKAQEAYTLMKAGELDGLSIGYECNDWENCNAADLGAKYGFQPTGPYASGRGSVRVLKSIDLWEVSIVTFPMNGAARIEAVKHLAAADATPNQITRIASALDRRGAKLRQIKQDVSVYAMAFAMMLNEIEAVDVTHERMSEVLSEVRVLAEAMSTDSDVDRHQAASAAEAIGVIRIDSRTVASVADSIVSYVAWRIYNIEADRMARRATPW